MMHPRLTSREHAGAITILSGPVGAGKTTVARELLELLPVPVAYIEGDRFWPLAVKPHSRDRREVFGIVMRSMTAAAMPFARSGYETLIDFSVPPHFLETARRIVKDVPLNYVALRPSLTICESRAAARAEGRITDYSSYRDFYTLFTKKSPGLLCDDEADAPALARRIYDGMVRGAYLVT